MAAILRIELDQIFLAVEINAIPEHLLIAPAECELQ